MARALGAELDEMVARGPRPWRYLRLGWRTWRRIARTPARDLFVMNPSIVLACVALAAARATGRRLVVDAHAAGLRPPRGLGPLARLVAARADLVIVTNPGAARAAQAMGARTAVMPDPLPVLPPGPAARCHLLLICGWAADEPFAAVMDAMRRLGDGFRLTATGDFRRSGLDAAALPANVSLAGFVDEARFLALLRGADLAIDLTTRDDCLVCGAYEAVAAGTPGLLSDTAANRAYFTGGFAFTRNEPDAVAAAIRDATQRLPALRRQIADLADELRARDRAHLAALEAALA